MSNLPHQDQELKQSINQVFEKKGVTHNLQARLLHETCNEIMTTDSGALTSLHPQIKIQRDVDAWEEAICLVVAYLKRYRMKETAQTMRKEYSATPSHTGYKRGSEVDDIFDILFDLIERDIHVTFEEKVEDFIQTTKIQEPMKPVKQKRGKK